METLYHPFHLSIQGATSPLVYRLGINCCNSFELIRSLSDKCTREDKCGSFRDALSANISQKTGETRNHECAGERRTTVQVFCYELFSNLLCVIG
ncbi:hypothetical protein GMOD_00006209 [Pyrenophora seminiperda CCB06]|uniref:Uncharacterized protein n=1 Tax=Pyrenophora seminiperda CCB06 TaxID=1302712 RepID=A0A3M7M4L0_9PLEO|nr:hypothetical protein GMOD_00006209 [Pyrenophora seminiperda CCB06]